MYRQTHLRKFVNIIFAMFSIHNNSNPITQNTSTNYTIIIVICDCAVWLWMKGQTICRSAFERKAILITVSLLATRLYVCNKDKKYFQTIYSIAVFERTVLNCQCHDDVRKKHFFLFRWKCWKGEGNFRQRQITITLLFVSHTYLDYSSSKVIDILITFFWNSHKVLLLCQFVVSLVSVSQSVVKESVRKLITFIQYYHYISNNLISLNFLRVSLCYLK